VRSDIIAKGISLKDSEIEGKQLSRKTQDICCHSLRAFLYQIVWASWSWTENGRPFLDQNAMSSGLPINLQCIMSRKVFTYIHSSVLELACTTFPSLSRCKSSIDRCNMNHNAIHRHDELRTISIIDMVKFPGNRYQVRYQVGPTRNAPGPGRVLQVAVVKGR